MKWHMYDRFEDFTFITKISQNTSHIPKISYKKDSHFAPAPPIYGLFAYCSSYSSTVFFSFSFTLMQIRDNLDNPH